MFFLFRLFDPILIAAAVLPAAFLMYKIYQYDRLEKESPSFLLSLAGLGILATLGAFLLESIGGSLTDWLVPGRQIHDVILFFLVVGLSEELCKYLLLRFRSWRSHHFNCQFDGVVYAVFVGLGFALAENISYVLKYGLGTALVRAVTVIPGHACFAVFMGAFYGAARRYENEGQTEKSRRMQRLALLVPTLLHGAYDYIATRMTAGYTLFFVIFVVLMFLLAFKLVRELSARDRYIN